MPFKDHLKSIAKKILHINDSPHRIALGFALGVFFGIVPGVGPIASTTVALMLRVNVAAALTASLVTNTWLSIVTWVLSLKIGSLVTGVNAQDLYVQGQQLIQNFTWSKLWDASIVTILKPLLIGNLIVAGVISFAVYLIMLKILLVRKR